MRASKDMAKKIGEKENTQRPIEQANIPEAVGGQHAKMHIDVSTLASFVCS